jgi:hypothetical protein
MIAESVFSPNDAEPAPMTVIFVGRGMVFSRICGLTKKRCE